MEAHPTFGPFQLVRPLGKGGMAMVWRAEHTGRSHPVAIKIMTGDRARKQRFVESFHREVRAVARLNHPNIVRVFDYGEVSEHIATVSEGHLVAGSPYMVMELAGSTLAQVDHSQLSWPHLHNMLVQILEGLAHAHARGLVHRDLKPDNVLFVATDNGGRLVLSDFGVAYATNTPRQLRAEDEVITGTPRYMAPEQIRGRLREQGPWTDLYALGCLAYWLASGAAMFTAESVDELLRAHLGSSRPRLEPTMEVPEGFEQWVRRLVARRPDDRFRRAADAAVSLAELAGEDPHEQITLRTATREGESAEMTVTEAPKATRVLDGALPERPRGPDDSHRASARAEPVARLPKTWRSTDRATSSVDLPGVGLGLFELREIPLVGRHAHRDVLWEHLADTLDTKRPHGVALRGPAGIGKTRLARWLAHRAHEVGAVDVLTARHSPIGGPADGLSRMFADALRCTGLSRTEILEQVRNWYGGEKNLDGDELHQCVALTDLLAPGADPQYDEQQAAIRFSSPEQRYVVWRRLLRKLTDRRRPVLMVLDDVQWGVDTLKFVRFLLENTDEQPLSVMAVMTVRPALLEQHPLAGQIFADLEKSPWVRDCHLGGLSETAHRRLIEQLLNLESELASRVADRTAGNPLFATQLVGDWVERGILEVGPAGFELSADEEPPLPDDVEGLLRHRIEQIVGHRLDEPAGDALVALQLGAVLGTDVDRREWQQLCELCDVAPPAELLDRLSAQSLVHLDVHSWSFAHGALRETLEGIAETAGRLEEYHRRCVQMLGEVYDASSPALAGRLARHLLAAGEHEAALDPLEMAIEYHYRQGDYDQCRQFFERHRRACDASELPEADPRRVNAKLTMAHTLLDCWETESARKLLDKCEQTCRDEQLDALLAKTLRCQARIARRNARLEEAVDLAEMALQKQRLQDDAQEVLGCLMTLGWTHYNLSNYPKVLQCGEKTARRARELDDAFFLASAFSLRGAASMEMGRYEKAEQHFRSALKISDEEGFIAAAANCNNNLGEVCRKTGELERARRYYERAYELRRRIGTGGWHTFRFNIGLVSLQQRDFEAALPHFETARQEADRTDDSTRVGLNSAAIAACAAGLGRWEQFDEHFERTESLATTSYSSTDLALVMEIAAEQAQEAGQHARANAARGIAIDQWRQVGETSRADELASRSE